MNAQLRPGADASRAEAELAAARTQLIQAQQAVEVTRANLSRFVGIEPAQITVSAPKLLQLPPEQVPELVNTTANPISMEQNSLVEQLKAQLKILERSYFPAFLLQASPTRAGPALRPTETTLGGLNGLAPTIQNSALGFTVTFPGVRPALYSSARRLDNRRRPGGDGPVPADCDRFDSPMESSRSRC